MGTGSFQGEKRPGREADHPLHLVTRPWKSRAIPLHPLGASVACYRVKPNLSLQIKIVKLSKINIVTRSNAVSHYHFPIPFPSAFLGLFAKLRLLASPCRSPCPSDWTWPPQYGFSWNLIIWTFFENLSRKFSFLSNLTRKMGILDEHLRSFNIPFYFSQN